MSNIIEAIKVAQEGNIITLKMMTQAQGYIIDGRVKLYFVRLDEDREYVVAALDFRFENKIKLSLRAIKQIINSDGTVIFTADPRDGVYGR